jgi:hypothetical protein
MLLPASPLSRRRPLWAGDAPSTPTFLRRAALLRIMSDFAVNDFPLPI